MFELSLLEKRFCSAVGQLKAGVIITVVTILKILSYTKPELLFLFSVKIHENTS